MARPYRITIDVELQRDSDWPANAADVADWLASTAGRMDRVANASVVAVEHSDRRSSGGDRRKEGR